MRQIKRILKDVENNINQNYIEKAYIQKEIKKLEKERNVTVMNKTDRVYDNYAADRIIKIINIKIDTLKELMEGGK